MKKYWLIGGLVVFVIITKYANKVMVKTNNDSKIF